MIYESMKLDDPSQGGYFDWTFSDDDKTFETISLLVNEKVFALLAVGIGAFVVNYVTREDLALVVSLEWGDQVGRATRGESLTGTG